MANVVHPRGRLEERDGDIQLSPKQYLKLSLFSQLKKPPDLDKFPGSIVIRRYRRKEELFRQGEPGWTAFYILTLDDVLAMRRLQLETARKENEKRLFQLEIQRLELQAKSREGVAEEEDATRQAATVHLASLDKAAPHLSIMRMTNFSSRPFAPIKNLADRTVYIPIGGPQTVSWETNRRPLNEGDLFGEMSCLYRTPRSATVVADRDCFIVEFLRNILEKIHRDVAFKAQAALFRQRILDMQVRRMPIFRDLDDKQFEEVRTGIELASFDPGELICDEHERSDSMYLVRQGLVKVMKGVSYMLSPADVTDWGALGQALVKGAAGAGSPHAKFWSLLVERTRKALQNAPDPAKLGPGDRAEAVFAVNDVLKDKKLTDAKEFKPIVDGAEFKAQLVGVPEVRKEWTDAHFRQANRLLFETLYPGGVRPYKKHMSIESILSYCSPGDYFGEVGLLLNQPRSASCVAYGHPNREGVVELVKIPSKTFWRLMRMSESIRDKVKNDVAARRKNQLTTMAKPVWEESNQVQFSEHFANLGLIQGQRLMLIDLDRCTRCDECVKACINTHDDGRSRLFLDGPRFGKYLVPTACRSCLDPVCMMRCPVASIHRGDNREIIIEDWCIGCEACAEDCPYGSIQMYDLGLVAEEARGWRFLPAKAKAAQGDWHLPSFGDKKWLTGATPFVWDRDMQVAVLENTPADANSTPLAERLVNFRLECEVGSLTAESKFKFEVMALGGVEHIWVNGHELVLDDRVKRGRHEYSVPLVAKGTEPQPATALFRRGRNVLAAQVKPPGKGGEILFQLRLDEIRKPKELPGEVDEKVAEEVVEKIVTHRAVVCDMCTSTGS